MVIMMTYEADFVDETEINLKVSGYPDNSFSYKPTTAGEENGWLNKYMKIDSDGKPYQDFSVLNKLKLNNLVKVPYSKELLQKMTGSNKEWHNYTADEKWLVLGKLKGKVFDNILNAINKYDLEGAIEKKD